MASIHSIIKQYSVTQIYQLAAILSAKGEQYPLKTWELNTKMMLNVFEVARKSAVNKVFFPSSIAVYGTKAPLQKSPQSAFLNPATVYGISKSAGENWAQYYFNKYNLDIRSIRYPGVIGYQSMPGGGTTDYAVDIYHSAVKKETFNCFLKADTKLPMIFMDDAIRATIELMQSPKENIKTRTSYNLGSMSLSPVQIYEAIKTKYPSFEIEYNLDFRQGIADNWPNSIDDKEARSDWGWEPKFDLKSMTSIMLEKLEDRYNKTN
jgi:nucleoside-diphosphate-sugar epimerase